MKKEVIFYRKKFFLVIKRVNDDLLAYEVKKDGFVKNVKVKLPNKPYKKVKNFKIKLKVEIKTSDASEFEYQSIVEEAKLAIGYILTNRDVENRKNYIAQLAFSATKLSNNKTLKDFANDIGLKKTNGYFKYLADKVNTDFKSINSRSEYLSDRALDKMISDYQAFWPNWYGFNKKLDKLLEVSFKTLLEERRIREANLN